MQVEWDVPIPMDDGVALRADVFRPDDDGRYPVIVSCGPYAKGLHFSEGFPGRWSQLTGDHPEVLAGTTSAHANFEMPDPEKWVPDGYVCVRIDSRGAGRSPGHLCLFQERETLDLYECVEWAARQPWSNGKVGLSGISYLAINQWQVATRQPPSLVAMIPWEGAADFYRDATYHGGIRSAFWDVLLEGLIGRVQHGYGDRGFANPNNGELVAGPETLSDEELAANRCDFRAEMRAHPLDAPLISAFEAIAEKRYGWYRAHGLDYPPEAWMFIRAAAGADTPVAGSLTDGTIVDLGGLVLETIHLPGHSPGHVGLVARGTGVTIVADAAQARGFRSRDGRLVGPPAIGDVAGYRTTATRLEALAPDALAASHFALVTGVDVERFLGDTIALMDDLEAEIDRALAEGPVTVAALLPRCDAALGPYEELTLELARPIGAILEERESAAAVVRRPGDVPSWTLP